MMRCMFKSFGKFLLVALISCVTFSSARAQVEGCNPLVMDAMIAKSQAQVAYDVAVISQLISQPDSVLAMTCFNQAASISAVDGGSIFSGDFTVQLTPLITPALQTWYGSGNTCGFICPNGKGNGNCYGNRLMVCGAGWGGNFANAIGFRSGVINYAVDALTPPIPDATLLSSPLPVPSFDCTGMADLWNLVRTEGIETGAPFASFDDLVNGVAGVYPIPVAPFAVGDDFMASWDASAAQNVFSNLNIAVALMPTPGVAPWIIPDFSKCKTSADVIALADLGIACPP